MKPPKSYIPLTAVLNVCDNNLFSDRAAGLLVAVSSLLLLLNHNGLDKVSPHTKLILLSFLFTPRVEGVTYEGVTYEGRGVTYEGRGGHIRG